MGVLLVSYQPFGALPADAAEKTGTHPAPKVVLNTNALPQDTHGLTSFAPMVKRVGPSVVTIYSSKKAVPESSANPFNDPLFRRFFGGKEDEDAPVAPAPRGRGKRRAPRQREQTEQSVGSGVIISADGYILSNNHVVEGADEVKISLSGSDDEYVAKIIGTDPHTDISVLKIEATNLPPITMTDSDHLQVGDVVLAVGNPFGVGQTVTMGIVSATGRGQFGIVDYEDFIQTDAAINPGNSGGALVDAGGRLVGINTAIISETGGSMGIGFAVPANMARRVMDSIIQFGKVTRGFLGISLAPEITPQLAKKFGLKDRSGALVNDVVNGTPAAKAGVQPGDVVLEFNGKKVPDSRQFRLWVSQTPPNTKVSLKVIRDGKERSFNMALGQLPGDTLVGGSGRGRSETLPKSDALEGVEVSDLDARTRRELEVPASVLGALVTAVDPDSTSAEAGLREGDIIQEINRQKVKNSQEAIDLSEKLRSDQSTLLRIWSARGDGGGSHYLVVEPTKPQKTGKDHGEP